MKASSAPISIDPESTRWPPNQTTPIVAMEKISCKRGNITANTAPMRRATVFRESFAPVYRLPNSSWRTNARMTLMPLSSSRNTVFILSRRSCWLRKSGLRMMKAIVMTMVISGTRTIRRLANCAFMRSVITMPPTPMIGAAIMKLKIIRITIWIC